MSSERKLRLIGALVAFGVALITYLVTLAPTLSFWDCGEFIAAANILGIPHPPGTPFFIILAKGFIDFMPFEDIAKRVNFISALTSALTVMMVFLFTGKLLSFVLRDKASRIAIFSAALGAAFLVTFSDTVWFNAVEAEVYGAAMFFIMTISYLSLLWVENRNTPQGARYLIFICYLAFLGVGLHLYTMMTIPAIFVLMLLVDKESRRNWPLWITGVMLMSVIYDIGDSYFYSLGMLVVCLALIPMSTNPIWRSRWKFCSWLCLAAVIGFSTHAYIPIRSSLNPRIDENNPETYVAFKEFLERKQYGSESMLKRAFHRRGQLLNQVLTHPHMGYGGYMIAQYLPWKVGDLRAEESGGIKRGDLTFKTQMDFMGNNKSFQMLFFLLLHIPIGYGLLQLYRRNRALGIYLGLLYGFSSFGLIFYMNFADGTRMEMRDWQYWQESGQNPSAKPPNVHMEVRERDYFYTPAFIFMSVLFGMAMAFLLEWVRRQRGGHAGGAVKAAAIALLVIAAGVPAFSNYKEHNRTGMYVPWDYAYNLLMSCRPNSVLFTNGDNDTFPLWYMQEVENIRMDVKVVNLSLVNTNWYIHQLRMHDPKLVLGFSSEEIDRLQPQPWQFEKPVPWNVPKTNVSLELQPRSYLKVQDIMVLNIVQNNFPARPIHFAVTVSEDNMMGLQEFLVMEGMVYTLTEEKKNREINVERTAHLVDSIYRFRGLGDGSTYIDSDTEGLLTNYSSTNFKLVSYAQDKVRELDQQIKQMEASSSAADLGDGNKNQALADLRLKRSDMVAFGEKYFELNARILPNEWRNHYFGGQFFVTVGRLDLAEKQYRLGAEKAPSPKLFAVNLAQLFQDQQKYAQAESLLVEWTARFPDDFELNYALSEAHQRRGQMDKARNVLANWLKTSPGHQYAPVIAQQLEFMVAPDIREPESESVPALPGADSIDEGIPIPAAGEDSAEAAPGDATFPDNG